MHNFFGDSCYTNTLYISDMYVVSQQSLYSRVPACQITTYYYVGFAYLMMKRYQVGKVYQHKAGMNIWLIDCWNS